MKIKFFSVLIACLVVTSGFSQSNVNLNKYKYVIVSKKFDFLKEANEYRLNELSQFLFNKSGFETVMEGTKYPEDLIRNRCLGLKADVLKDSGMFKTKLNVQLKDCNDQIIYASEFGESREKEYSKAYAEALRKAFKSIEALDYKYEPIESIKTPQTPKVKNEVAAEIQQLKEEIQSLKKEKEVVAPIIAEAIKPVTVPQILETKEITIPTDVLYAQEIENGFQLVDSAPALVYKIKKTGLLNVFIVEEKKAILYQTDDTWILEYYTNNTLKQEVLNIKF
jgi:hypothetical protein